MEGIAPFSLPADPREKSNKGDLSEELRGRQLTTQTLRGEGGEHSPQRTQAEGSASVGWWKSVFAELHRRGQWEHPAPGSAAL